MGIAISSIGLATAQGSTVELSNGNRLRAPECWPWPVNGWTTSHFCRPALGVSPALVGIARWLALVQSALKDCLGDLTPSARTPRFSRHAMAVLTGLIRRVGVKLSTRRHCSKVQHGPASVRQCSALHATLDCMRSMRQNNF